MNVLPELNSIILIKCLTIMLPSRRVCEILWISFWATVLIRWALNTDSRNNSRIHFMLFSKFSGNACRQSRKRVRDTKTSEIGLQRIT